MMKMMTRTRMSRSEDRNSTLVEKRGSYQLANMIHIADDAVV
jgi:hypothetical protein